jgi:hypothetical protein
LNTQEREELAAFLLQLKNTQLGIKDAEAEALIQETCRQQPDASYLLVQRAILLGHALAKGQKETSQLQEALASSKSGEGFLGGNAWGNSPARSVPRSQSAPVPNMAPAATGPSWGSSI